MILIFSMTLQEDDILSDITQGNVVLFSTILKYFNSIIKPSQLNQSSVL